MPLQHSPRYFSLFLSFCHNKAGGTRGDTSGVRDAAWLTEQGYSTLFWLVALICQWWKQELSVPSGRACKQKGWVGGGTRPFICVHTHTNIHTVAVKLQGLDMQHKMLTCHYIPPTVFSLWLALRGKKKNKTITISNSTFDFNEKHEGNFQIKVSWTVIFPCW